jgi:hypothetical protein
MLVAALRREQEQQHELTPVQDDLAPSEPLLRLDT